MSANINKIIDETLELQLQIKGMQATIAKNKEVIQKHFDNLLDKGKTSIETDFTRATKVESAYITYKGYQLEKKLKDNNKKKLVDKVIKKTYSIIDINAFIELMKLTEISPYTIKSHIKVEREVDGQSVKRLFETGELTKEDLQGTFDSKIVNSIRLSELK